MHHESTSVVLVEIPSGRNGLVRSLSEAWVGLQPEKPKKVGVQPRSPLLEVRSNGALHYVGECETVAMKSV